MHEPDYIAAHRDSSRHREQVIGSTLCGCFYCCKTFEPAKIREWIDAGQTALCPCCGIDAVIGNASRYPLTQEFLGQMKAHWFRAAGNDLGT